MHVQKEFCKIELITIIKLESLTPQGNDTIKWYNPHASSARVK